MGWVWRDGWSSSLHDIHIHLKIRSGVILAGKPRGGAGQVDRKSADLSAVLTHFQYWQKMGEKALNYLGLVGWQGFGSNANLLASSTLAGKPHHVILTFRLFSPKKTSFLVLGEPRNCLGNGALAARRSISRALSTPATQFTQPTTPCEIPNGGTA